MKIKVWSDLHLEFRDYLFDHIHIPSTDDKETTLLLAGDISVGTTAKPFIEEMCKHFKYVLMICGNHEFYYNDYNNVIRSLQEYSWDEGPENFYFLHNDTIVLDGVRFIGGTMWTNINDGDPISMGAAHRIMCDYQEIKDSKECITPEFTILEYDKFINFLLKEFDKLFDGNTVVMTHHSPGNELKRRGRHGDRVGACYFADIEEMIGYHNKAKLWVHGHTHQSWDYMINETRVVCNPYGYWGKATNREFDRGLLIEI